MLQGQRADLAVARQQALDPVHPAATSRRSSSPSIALPTPRRRHAGVRLIRITRARSPLTTATAVPASPSPTTGCIISHGNLTEAVRAITGVPGVRERVLTEGSCSLFFLPPSHILAPGGGPVPGARGQAGRLRWLPVRGP
jgi:hypothetical protein